MSLALRLALRDLRGGFSGLRLLALCLFLGVAAIAGVGSLSASILAELSSRGSEMLGGDVAVALTQRQATPVERAAIARLGRVSESATMRAMASRPDGAEAVLVELKAVDAAYPLYGRLSLAPGALPVRPARGQVLIAPALADRLRVKVGDNVRIGEAALRVAGIVADEPDRVGEGFTLGPVALIDMATLARTGLLQPGSLYSWRYKVALPRGADAGAIADRLGKQHAEDGWRVRDARDGAPSMRRTIERIGQFLTLVGLAALLVAGVGVGNGVGAYLEGKRASIATLKTLGASSGLIFRLYLAELGIVAAGAILVALAVGAITPAAVGWLARDSLPVPPRLGLYPAPLATAAACGLLVALAFALPPLARARAVGAATLFRGALGERRRPPAPVLLASVATILTAAGIAAAASREPLFAAEFLAAATALLALLAGVALAVRAIAARLPRPRGPLLRLALARLHAPGSPTPALIVALGLGLSLFATLAVVQTNLANQIRTSVPARAPAFFALDIPADGLGRFVGVVRTHAPAAAIVTVPSLRGPIVALNGVRVADMRHLPEGAWILRGDRGLTFAADVPQGNRITAGRWWPRDYAGPPLVSMDAAAGKLLGLRVGDSITVSVLGVEVPARIASFREINWDSLGFNFVLIFSPHAFDGAPFSYMATIELPAAREAPVNRAVAAAFPSVSLIRVRDVIGMIGGLIGQLAAAIAAASTIAVAAGIAVLAGAIAAARRARVYDAVLLKLLGATRGQVLLLQAMEYALLGLLLALVALAVGAGAGWYVVTRLFELEWAPDWAIVGLTLAAGAGLTLIIGLLGSLPVLAARPARALRSL